MAATEISASHAEPLDALAVPAMQKFLQQFPGARRFVVAYSGGVDSHVLLDLCRLSLPAGEPVRLEALHVDHALQAASAGWAGHCQTICEHYGVTLTVHRVDARHAPGESPEEVAREYRRKIFLEALQAGDVLLLAQHADDQLETVLLQLFRGAGLAGLSGMPLCAPAGLGVMVRPMLKIPRTGILDYARRQRLDWVEDPSNQDTGVPRNFLRQRIVPSLLTQWPGLRECVARSAAHCSEAALFQQHLAERELSVLNTTGKCCLPVSLLESRPVAEQKLLMRHWIRAAGFRAPSTRVLNRVLVEMLSAAPDRNPLVAWQECELRRYRDCLYIMQPLPDLPAALPWQGQTVNLPGEAMGVLDVTPVAHQSRHLWVARPAWHKLENLTVEFAGNLQGVRLLVRGQHKSLQRFFQENGLPVWVRSLHPLVFSGDELVVIPGLWVDSRLQGEQKHDCINVSWLDFRLGWKGSD